MIMATSESADALNDDIWQPKQPRLLSIPAEIQNQIWKHVLFEQLVNNAAKSKTTVAIGTIPYPLGGVEQRNYDIDAAFTALAA
jgi:hypothetical protein